MAIRVLDAATAARIAAGEVVERPSSVAKELVENALDAGATSITVEMKDGGETYLRVTDNGCGIAASEVRLAFENHATSKLRAAEDLDDIRTMGFRGEALPSIAAVSKLTCTTRQKDIDSGVRLEIEGGHFVSFNEVGCPVGTSVVVRDLFFNTPVRKTFLKKPAYEAGVLTDLIAKLMLANPGVAIKLIGNGKTIYQTYGDGSLQHAALAVFGKEIAAKMTSVDAAIGSLRISGLIGVGDCARPNRNGQSFFINGRVVRCLLLSQVLEQVCAGRVTIGQYPICALTLTLPTQSVDVNVHPSKLEVRFRDDASMRASLLTLLEPCFGNERVLDDQRIRTAAELTDRATPAVRVVKEELPQEKPTKVDIKPTKVDQVQTAVGIGQTEVGYKQTGFFDATIPTMVGNGGTVSGASVLREVPNSDLIHGWAQSWQADNAPVGADSISARPPQSDIEPTQTESSNDVAPFRVIGVLYDTYLLVETADAFLLIDQHAAHERILYERYTRSLNSEIHAQTLLMPQILSVTAREMAQIEANRDLLEEAGYEVDAYGEQSVAIRAVPFILGKAEMKPVFMEILDRLDTLKYAAQERKRSDIIQLACKHAVKAGDKLSHAEICELVSTMRATEAPSTCPHGRPVYRMFTRNELERMFKRQQ